MRYLSEDEILSWNNRLKESNDYKLNHIMVYPVSDLKSYGNQKYLTFREIGHNSTKNIADPICNYQLIFSISSNRVDKFLDIFNNILNIGISNYVINDITEWEKNNYNKQQISLKNDIISEKKETTYEIYNKQYTKFSYSFKGNLSSIIAYVTILEDSMELLNMTWGYNEDGSECFLLPYSIGMIVSTKSNTDSDYLVTNYIYKYSTSTNSYDILYNIEEIKKIGETIIIHGNTTTVSKDFIKYNRDSRIDDILN